MVQLDRRKDTVTDEAGVWAKFGVAPTSIPDWLALVGDTADGFPGLAGWGKRSASVVLAHYGSLNEIPDALSAWDPAVRQELRGAAKLAERLATERELALLFKDIATLRTKPPVLRNVASLRWRGPKSDFEDVCRHFRDPALAERAAALAKKI